MKNHELWIAPLLAGLLSAGCSKGPVPPEPQAAKSPDEKVYTTKDLETLAAEPTPSPSPEAVQEPAEPEEEPTQAPESEPAPPPSASPRAKAAAASVPGQYTNADIDKLPPTSDLPPPLEGGKPAAIAQEAKETPAAGTSYTNTDLKDLPERAPAEQRPGQNTHERQLAEAEQKVSDAQARVDELEARLRAVRNPFLPRPELPPAEQEAWQTLDGVQRAQRVEQQLQKAREELSSAVEGLQRLRTPEQR